MHLRSSEVGTPSDVRHTRECVHRISADPYPLFGLPCFPRASPDGGLVAFLRTNYIPTLPFCQDLGAITPASHDASHYGDCIYEVTRKYCASVFLLLDTPENRTRPVEHCRSRSPLWPFPRDIGWDLVRWSLIRPAEWGWMSRPTRSGLWLGPSGSRAGGAGDLGPGGRSRPVRPGRTTGPGGPHGRGLIASRPGSGAVLSHEGPRAGRRCPPPGPDADAGRPGRPRSDRHHAAAGRPAARGVMPLPIEDGKILRSRSREGSPGSSRPGRNNTPAGR